MEYEKNAGGTSGARPNLGEMRYTSAGERWKHKNMRGPTLVAGPRDKSFLLDHDDTRAALGLYQIPDLLAIVI